jgi:hypothetical protein
MGASQHRERSSGALSAFTATGARTFAMALLVAKHCASLPVATTACIVATQKTTEGPTHTSAGRRDLTHTMSPANLDRCSPGCASEKPRRCFLFGVFLL